MVTIAPLLGALLNAQAVDAPPPPPEPDELPPKVAPPANESISEGVTIRREESRTIEEYRSQGQIYMVKVTHDSGTTYYLLDADGDGQLETQDIETGPGVQPVYWKLFEW